MITIIVLLILAGVAITTLTGENGILNQSQQASLKTNKESELETIRLAVMGSLNNDGNLDLTMLLSNLENELQNPKTIEPTIVNNQDTFPVMVTAKYGMYEINENGKVENTSGVTLNETDLKIFAGSTVTLTATVSSDLLGKTVSWSTASSTVASISAETGESITVTAGTSGNTTITAQVEGGEKVGVCTISIVQAVSSIVLDNTTLEIEQGGTEILTATVNPTTNVEDIEFVIDSNANEAGAYFGSSGTLTKIVSVGTDGKATVEVSVPEDSSYLDKTTTIRAQGKNTGNVSGKVGICEIAVIEPISPNIGDYIQYGVGYVDSLNPAQFSANDGLGWRILDIGNKNSNGDYENVKIISTRVPTRLYLWMEEGGNSELWWGTTQTGKIKKYMG